MLSSTTIGQADSVQVSLDVRNTGSIAGAEVVQLYVRDLEASVYRPSLELREFAKVPLSPGQSQTVSFTLPPRAFAFYDVKAGDWYVEPGEFEVLLAASVVDVRLSARLTVSGAPREEVGGAAVPTYTVLSDSELGALGLRVSKPPRAVPLRRTSLVKEVGEHGGCCGMCFYKILTLGNEIGGGEVEDPGEKKSREEMLRSLPLQQLKRFAHCDSAAARNLFTDSVLDGLIGMFNLTGGTCCMSRENKAADGEETVTYTTSTNSI